MAKTTQQKEKDIYRIPGRKQLQQFLSKHSKLFNFSELERMCKLPSGTLRHICAGSRDMDNAQYKVMQETILPKLCELVFLLQNYSVSNEVYRYSSWDD